MCLGLSDKKEGKKSRYLLVHKFCPCLTACTSRAAAVVGEGRVLVALAAVAHCRHCFNVDELPALYYVYVYSFTVDSEVCFAACNCCNSGGRSNFES